MKTLIENSNMRVTTKIRFVNSFLFVCILFYCENLISQCSSLSSISIKTGYNYSLNNYSVEGQLDPFWTVIKDNDPSTIEPRIAVAARFGNLSIPPLGRISHTQGGGPFMNINNWACTTYANSCVSPNNTPCTASYPIAGIASPSIDKPIIFRYSFCINQGENLNAISLNVASFIADDYGKVCLNGNHLNTSFGASTNSSFIVNNHFQYGVNVIEVSIYNFSGVTCNFLFDGILSTTVVGATPFKTADCCGMNSSYISGKKFFDANKDGLLNFQDFGIPNWTISLKNPITNAVIATTTTDFFGNYQFINLSLNTTYNVYENLQMGFIQTSPSTLFHSCAIGSSPTYLSNKNFGNSDCLAPNISGTSNGGCTDYPIKFDIVTAAESCYNTNLVYNWNFGDGASAVGLPVSHMYSSAGSYNITLTILNPPSNPIIVNSSINITACQTVNNCKDCIGSFSPEPGEYILSLWVKQQGGSNSFNTYANTGAKISFIGSAATYGPFYPNLAKNKIIDGWQRIEEKFMVPVGATSIKIELINNNSPLAIDSYFDDIRIHPINGNMKSYVYDPVTLRLSAELDENNYATFYEYDEEGKLIRVKKETERGIMTIKEAKNNTKKK